MKPKTNEIKAGLIKCPRCGWDAQVTLSIGLNLATHESGFEYEGYCNVGCESRFMIEEKIFTDKDLQEKTKEA